MHRTADTPDEDSRERFSDCQWAWPFDVPSTMENIYKTTEEELKKCGISKKDTARTCAFLAPLESVIGVGPSPGPERGNVMTITRGSVWCLHLLPDCKGQVSVKIDRRPQSLALLRNGVRIPFRYWDGYIKFSVPAEQRADMDDVVGMEL
jgi:hypothetical protein